MVTSSSALEVVALAIWYQGDPLLVCKSCHLTAVKVSVSGVNQLSEIFATRSRQGTSALQYLVLEITALSLIAADVLHVRGQSVRKNWSRLPSLRLFVY